MGKRGPKPKPTALKRAMGNPGHRTLSDAEPVFDKTKGDKCPAHLRGIARAMWTELAPQLNKQGLLTDPDRKLLEMACVEYARYRKAQAEIAKHGEVQVLKSGYQQTSGWLTVAKGAYDRYMKAVNHFGLSPSARVGLETKAPEANPLEVFIRGKKSS